MNIKIVKRLVIYIKTSPTNFIPASQTIKLIKLINGPGKEKSQVGPGEEGYDHPLSQERVDMSP